MSYTSIESATDRDYSNWSLQKKIQIVSLSVVLPFKTVLGSHIDIDLISEHPVLTGEGETLHDSPGEILESFGGEPAMKSLIAAV